MITFKDFKKVLSFPKLSNDAFNDKYEEYRY